MLRALVVPAPRCPGGDARGLGGDRLGPSLSDIQILDLTLLRRESRVQVLFSDIGESHMRLQ